MYEIILSCIYMKEFKSKFTKLTEILVKMPLFNKDSSSYKSVSRAQFEELPSRTVHLWKSRSMVRKGYIQCTCRINLWNRKYRFTLIESFLKLAVQTVVQNTAPQALIGGVNFWTSTWLYNIVLLEKNNFMYKPCFSNLKAGNLRLNLHISKLEAFVLWDARIECQVTFEVLYFHFPEFQSLWKLHLVVSDISYSALSVPFYFCYMFCVNSKMACKRVF